MKIIIPAALLGMIFLSSCSTMYKTGQTPDDVYYSPARPAAETVRKEEDTRDEYTYTQPDDNYLRMVVHNRNRWNTINDADYWYSYNRPYQYTHSNYNWNNTWSYGYSSYPLWSENYNYGYNTYGNPYYYNYGYYGYQPGTIVRNLRSNTGPKPYMGSQTNTNYDNRNNTYGTGKNASGLGNVLRNVFTPNSNTRTTTTNSSGDTYSNPVRTFTPSTPSTSTPSSSSGSNSSSGRSSTGSSSSSSRPGRGGN